MITMWSIQIPPLTDRFDDGREVIRYDDLVGHHGEEGKRELHNQEDGHEGLSEGHFYYLLVASFLSPLRNFE